MFLTVQFSGGNCLGTYNVLFYPLVSKSIRSLCAGQTYPQAMKQSLKRDCVRYYSIY